MPTPSPRLDLLRTQLAHHDRLVGGFTRALELAQARWHEGGDERPSIAWQLGHLTWVADSVRVAVAEQTPLLDPREARHTTPHWGVRDADDWRTLLTRWERVAAARRDALAALDDDVLALPPAVPMDPRVHGGRSTRERFLVGHVFHVAYHLGQIGALRAAQGLGWDTLALPGRHPPSSDRSRADA